MNLSINSNFISTSIDKFFNFFTCNEYENIKRLVFAVIIFFVFLLLRRFLTRYVFKVFKKIIDKIKPNEGINLISSFEAPFNMIFLVFGIFFALVILGKNYFISIPILSKILRSVLVVLITWGMYNFIGEISNLSGRMKERFGFEVDKILFPFISKCFKVILIALSITIILAEWNINIQMLVTGLGIGGLAISLAAKDAASNVIAGVILIMDKPFNMGDWISTSEVEGVVEDLSFRSTKIRTFTQELVVVPNSSLANTAITNYTRRGKRKCNFSVSISYETSREKIEGCISKIEDMVRKHKNIYDEDVIIAVDTLNSSSIDIGIYYFTDILNLKGYLDLKQEVNLNIMDILKSEGVTIPYPTTTVYLNDLSHKNDVIEKDSVDKDGYSLDA